MTFWKLSTWWPCCVSPYDHTHTQIWIFDFICVAVKLWMMSTGIKKGWVVKVSVLTTPLCNTGVYTKVLHVDTLAAWTFLPHSETPTLLLNVLCPVTFTLLWCPLLRVASLPPSVFRPSVNMQYRGHAGDPELPVAEQWPPSTSTAVFYSSKRLSSDNNIFCFKTAAPSLLSLVDSMYRLEMFLSWDPPQPPPPPLPSSLHCVCFSLQGYLLLLFWC